ncbi:formylglycine-generating enzyme family protein [Sorangium cellulosum]|nr:SUMF1/EgtB/PvdO family nonheme iron enzyme [Sorangium cellulosum]
MWAVSCLAAAGCTTIAGIDKPYHPAEGGAGGGIAGAGGGGGGSVEEPCTPEEARCRANRPQRCDEAGRWQDEAECSAEAPVCRDGACVNPPSCAELPATCGLREEESCCATTAVPGGSFHRGADGAFPATVSDFLLDRFEVTVGRFRAFVDEYPASWPAAGAGEHPRNPGSGWDTDWDEHLPVAKAELMASLVCEELPTWTDEAGANEVLPLNCVTWYLAFAFCAWDGGRLPTEAEWHYAAVGGDELRLYPWTTSESSATLDSSYAVYGCGMEGGCVLEDVPRVGSRSPRGDSRWGQADMAGSVWDWLLDSYVDEYPAECDDCVVSLPDTDRPIRGGGWRSAAEVLLPAYREPRGRGARMAGVGLRCAREP